MVDSERAVVLRAKSGIQSGLGHQKVREIIHASLPACTHLDVETRGDDAGLFLLLPQLSKRLQFLSCNSASLSRIALSSTLATR